MTTGDLVINGDGMRGVDGMDGLSFGGRAISGYYGLCLQHVLLTI